jgi:uncharacterized protein DUF4267
MGSEAACAHLEGMQHLDDQFPRFSAAYVMTALLGTFMAFLAIRGVVDPISAAHGYGVDLAAPADAFYLYVKADRDLAIAALLFGLLAYRRATPLIIVVGSLLLAPLGDAILVTARHSLGYALAVHGSAVAYGIALVAVLARARRQAR